MMLLFIAVCIFIVSSIYWWVQCCKARAQLTYLRTVAQGTINDLSHISGSVVIAGIKGDLKEAVDSL